MPSMRDQSRLENPQDLAFVCWRGSDGARVRSCPLERAHAEALARAYAEFFPERNYWLEAVPWLEPRPPRSRGNA